MAEEKRHIIELPGETPNWGHDSFEGAGTSQKAVELKDLTEEKPVRAPQIQEVVPWSRRGIILTRSFAVRRGRRPKVKNDRKSLKGTANENSESSPEDMQKLLDNMRSLTFILLGLGPTIGGNVLVEGHKAAISHAFADFLAYSFAVMFVLSALTSASACVLPPRANVLNAIFISVLLMILYNINQVFILTYIWEVNHGREIRARLIAVASALNIGVAVSWIFIWGERKELFADALTVVSNKLWWFLREMATYTIIIAGAMLSVFKRIILLLFGRVLVCFGLRGAASQG